jgi:hypothetical protein
MCSGQPVGSDMTSPPIDFSTIADRLEISVEQSGVCKVRGPAEVLRGAATDRMSRQRADLGSGQPA